MHRKVAAALVAALALALASCGESQKTETVSRAQAVSRLQAACQAGQREAKRDLGSSSGQVAFANALIANMRTVSDKIENLEATGSARAPFDAYKATLDTRIEQLERVASAGRADMQAAIRAAQPVIATASRRAEEALAQLGTRQSCV